MRRKTTKIKTRRRTKRNPLKNITAIDFFEIPIPESFISGVESKSEGLNDWHSYELGTILGFIQGLELCDKPDFHEDIKLFYQKLLKQSKKTSIDGSIMIKLEDNNRIKLPKNTYEAFETGVIVGLNKSTIFCGDKYEINRQLKIYKIVLERVLREHNVSLIYGAHLKTRIK